MKMEEDTELEEGEACFCKDDDNDIGLESLSYIDERIQHVLGQFQKDFEGGDISAENLGAKFGGYGSFLPTYERPCVRPDSKTPQRNYNLAKSPKNLHLETASDNSKLTSNVPSSTSLQTSSIPAQSIHTLRAHSVDYSMKKDVAISANAVAERCPLNDDNTNKLGNSNDQRSLKFRIKMRSNIPVQKNMAIYSGLGLDDSPSSSMGNSPEEDECMPPLSQDTAEESPTGIIQVMSSFPIPGGALLSPLHESLLCLRKEKVFGVRKPMSSLNSSQEHCSVSADESDSFGGDGRLLKKPKVRIVGQSKRQLELKHKDVNGLEKETTLHTMGRLEYRTPDRKDFLSNDLKCTPLSSLICDAGEPAEFAGKVSEVSLEINKDGGNGRMSFTKALKEESLESISGLDFDKSEKQHIGDSLIKRVSERKFTNSLKDNSTNPKINDKCKANMISQKTKCDAIKLKVNKDPHKHGTNQKEKLLSGGMNNLKGDLSSGTAVAPGGKDSFGVGVNASLTGKKSAGFGVNSKIQMHKTLKDNKVRDGDRESSKGKKLEPPGHRTITNANLDSDVERRAYRVKVKGRPSADKVGSQLIAEPSIKDASNAHPVSESILAPEIFPAAAPQVIAEDWVCCDRCQKWRLLPLGIKPEQLPEKWLCSMLNWLPGMNRCDINEEETTQAVYALNQMPVSKGQNNLQIRATGTAIGLNSANASHVGSNLQKSSSDLMSGQGKKKHAFKEKTKAGISNDVFQFSRSSKTNAQECGKNKGLIGMNLHPENSNPVKKSSYQHLIRLNNLTEEKHMPKEKVKQANKGDIRHIKLKSKMEADQYTSNTPKKSKTEDVYQPNSQLNADKSLDKMGVMGLNTRKHSSANDSGKDRRKYEEYCSTVDLQDKLVDPVQKLGDDTQVLLNGASLGARTSSKDDLSLKKRKLKEWMDNNKKLDNALSLQDGIHLGEEGSVSEFRKEKKKKVLKTQSDSDTEGGNEFDKRGGMSRIFLSVSRDCRAVDTEVVRSLDQAQQQKKHRRNITSQQASDGNGPSGRELSSGQLSLAATSSSSLISGSHKAITNFKDVKSSPVESITSSPLRISNLDKPIITERDTSRKNAAAIGNPSSMSSKRCLDKKEEKQSMKRKKRVSNDLHPEWHKFSLKEWQVEDGKAKVQSKNTSELGNDQLLSGGIYNAEHVSCASGAHRDDRVNKNIQGSEFPLQESGKVTPLPGEKKATENGYWKNGGRHEPAVDLSYHKSGYEVKNDAKYISSKSKHGIENIVKNNSVRSWPSPTGKQIELKPEDFENSVLKVDIPCSTNGNVLSQQNQIQDFKEENKVGHACTESRDVKLEVPSSSDEKVKRATVSVSSRGSPVSQDGVVCNGHPFHVSGNGDVAKLVKSSADARNKVGVCHSSGNFALHQPLNTSSPVTLNSSQTASMTLHEAAKLKDSADHYKDSGFEFESNETYFEAALKFLLGASLLENCQSESNKHGEMSQLQIYSTTAKLFKSCAHEYERRQEMAAAALAYKCMEVAYMRVVYCKDSSTNRLWHELQSTLHTVPQGESPSSSASDVDNLINQAAMDKVTLPRSTGTNVAANQVISVENHPTFFQLLDFTQDVNFAMEASRKCQSTFAAASVVMEEARNKECIASIKRVVNFSFQAVDELVHLVWAATKAISRSGLDGARD